MTLPSLTDDRQTRLDVPASIASVTPFKAETLWQRMFNAWLDTYKLSSKSGAVPFLLM